MSVLKWLSSRLFAHQPRSRVRRDSSFRPGLEALEDRSLPSTLTVTNTSDSGAGSLRNAVTNAAPGSTIVFAPSLAGKTIKLTSAEIVLDKSVTIQGGGAVTISGNGAFRIFDVNDSTPTVIKVNLSGLTFTAGKNTGLGGAILNEGENLSLSGDVFVGNTAGNGGAVSNAFGSTLSVLNSTFSSNTTTSVGGGALINFGTATIQNTTISGNHGPINGGGINVQPGGTLTLINTTVANNTSGGLGGGISSLGKLNIFNSTIAGNQGTGGGGIATSNPNTTIQSSIVAKNKGGDLSGGAYHVNYSLIGSSVGVTFAAGSGNNILNKDPLLGPLQNNGGPTLTMLPAANSPVIGKGANPKNLTTDQRGVPRSSIGVDIGAVQVTGRRMGAIG
ncbi:MAG TPA: choice-of-anchor Q domain-containing protein [Gemmataceae bacterium]|nr:choice-of-anchor Q domain-containing protein [Gemmataceae bacterium]